MSQVVYFQIAMATVDSNVAEVDAVSGGDDVGDALHRPR